MKKRLEERKKKKNEFQNVGKSEDNRKGQENENWETRLNIRMSTEKNATQLIANLI